MLPTGHPGRRFKGRVVFQGNRVFDEWRESALFQDLGSSPSTMDAARAADLYGCAEDCDEEIADAERAYTQAPFDESCTETWVLLPETQWKPEWKAAVAAGTMVKPVVRLTRALYGHPDAGSMWERYCHKHLVTQGFVSLSDRGWPGCYHHPRLSLFLTVYVDDFKLAGPRVSLAAGWKLIREPSDSTKGLKTEDPMNIHNQVYLGCRHLREIRKLPNGKSIRLMTYDMSDFFDSCVDKYRELASSLGQKKPITPKAATPFLPEDMKESELGKPTSTGPSFQCCWCKASYPLDSITATEMDPKKTSRKSAKSDAIHGTVFAPSKTALLTGPKVDEKGVLAPIAAQALMKLLYGARYCRPDLLRAISTLARCVTKWDLNSRPTTAQTGVICGLLEEPPPLWLVW